jgi:hypothetical protein
MKKKTPNVQRPTLNKQVNPASIWKTDYSNSARGSSVWLTRDQTREPQTMLRVSFFAVGPRLMAITVKLELPNRANISSIS